jgi:hypothetical protein
MSVSDLIKATVFCGGVAFLAFRFPVISQALVIGMLAVLWASFAHKAVQRVIQR